MNTQKQTDSPLTVANLCCLSGAAMVLYAAFLLHTALGFAAAGSSLITVGVILYRGRRATNSEPRQAD